VRRIIKEVVLTALQPVLVAGTIMVVLLGLNVLGFFDQDFWPRATPLAFVQRFFMKAVWPVLSLELAIVLPLILVAALRALLKHLDLHPEPARKKPAGAEDGAFFSPSPKAPSALRDDVVWQVRPVVRVPARRRVREVHAVIPYLAVREQREGRP
jgi:hypothetical protein